MAHQKTSNINVYTDPDVVSSYLHADYLEAAEARVIRLFKDGWQDMDMLDIAVGAGRTTQYFAPLVKTYTGVDYSEGMISACKEKFSKDFPNAHFDVADMRSLSGLQDNSFSFVLISYNAISALDHAGHQKTLREVHRVLRPGGHLFFSIFNLPSVYRRGGLFHIDYLFRNISFFKPKHSYWVLTDFLRRRIIYHTPVDFYWRWKKAPSAMITDGSHNFRLKHYYVRANKELSDLSRHFENIRVFDRDGDELTDDTERNRSQSDWLFYLCANKAN